MVATALALGSLLLATPLDAHARGPARRGARRSTPARAAPTAARTGGYLSAPTSSGVEALADRVPGASREGLELALRAFGRMKERGLVQRDLLTFIDYAQPSTAKRLWVIDLEKGEVLFQELVAHGRGSGDDRARAFSNEGGSKKSSLGAFVTLDTYDGKHGYSLRLRGLDAGLNDQAEARAIVVHGADYVGEAFIRREGRLGRSWGCPALRPEIAKAVIDVIKEGTAVFAYFPEPALRRRAED